MPVWIALILGAVQGLTEFLPVSSSGHLALMQNILDVESYLENALAFDVVLHLGTLTAVIIAFKKDIVELIRAALGLIFDGFKIKDQPYRRMIVLLLISTVPLVLGAFLEGVVGKFMSKPLLIGIALCVTAGMLWFADRSGGGKKTAADAPYRSAVVVGLMQLVAVIPGISRSGSTLCGGLFCGYKRSYAVTFAFMLSIPAVVGASILEIPDLISTGVDKSLVLPCIIGFVTSLIFGYIAIRLVQTLTKRNSLKYFALYCAVVGVVSIILSLV